MQEVFLLEYHVPGLLVDVHIAKWPRVSTQVCMCSQHPFGSAFNDSTKIDTQLKSFHYGKKTVDK